MNRERLLRRIRSLLVLADPCHGAPAPERAAAGRLAARLMQANGLTEADVPQREVARRQPMPPPPPPIFIRKWSFTFTVDIGNTATSDTCTSWEFGW